MSKIEKILNNFVSNPQSVHYRDIEKILIFIGFTKIKVKGSHVKFKHNKLTFDIIIPVHLGDCKPFYKKQIKTQIIHFLK